MRTKDPVHEKQYVQKALAPLVKRLARNVADQVEFLEFARIHGGADPLQFPARLARVLKGEQPTAYMAMLLVDWGRTKSGK